MIWTLNFLCGPEFFMNISKSTSWKLSVKKVQSRTLLSKLCVLHFVQWKVIDSEDEVKCVVILVV